MVNYGLVIKGICFFFIGTLGSILTYQIGTIFLTALSDAADTAAMTTEEQAIVWIGMIIIWIMLMIIVPANYVIQGLKEQNKE